MTRLLVAGIVCFSVLTVYTQYVFLHATDDVTHRPFRSLSLEQYHETLEGRRPFPYQWRVAGPWLVRSGEVLTGGDPHAIDVVLKVIALAGSAVFLALFAKRWTTPLGVVLVLALYFVLTAAAYSSEGYSIYFTNDFLMVLGWNAAVYLEAEKRYVSLALVIFATAWAKETIVLALFLVGLAWWRSEATTRDGLLCAAGFLIPTAFLRIHYPARFADWAWWGNVMLNVPFLRWRSEILIGAIRDNLKVMLFFNVLWLLAYQAFRRTTEPVLRDLVIVAAGYLVIAYVVVYIRELRHFLPLAIVILPLGVIRLEEILHTTKGEAVSAL